MLSDTEPINVGDTFIWERPRAWKRIVVTAIEIRNNETWIESEDERGKRAWNSEDWFREACSRPK